MHIYRLYLGNCTVINAGILVTPADWCCASPVVLLFPPSCFKYVIICNADVLLRLFSCWFIAAQACRWSQRPCFCSAFSSPLSSQGSSSRPLGPQWQIKTPGLPLSTTTNANPRNVVRNARRAVRWSVWVRIHEENTFTRKYKKDNNPRITWDEIFAGKLCIEVTPQSKIAFISESLCIGCGICVKVDTFLAAPPPLFSSLFTL